MAMTKEVAAVIAKMRARKVNHGKHTSPTLIEWADELESALSASAEPVASPCTCPSGDGSLRWPCPQHPPTESLGRNALSGWDDALLNLITQYGHARASHDGRGPGQEQKDARNARDARVSAYSKILDHLELRATPAASCNPITQPASVPDDWMPIGTAPKNEIIQLGRAATDECDGVSLQGFWREGFGDGQDYYMGQDSGFVDTEFQQFHGGRSFGPESFRYKPNQPTHWKPRSPPPTTPETRT